MAMADGANFILFYFYFHSIDYMYM